MKYQPLFFYTKNKPKLTNSILEQRIEKYVTNIKPQSLKLINSRVRTITNIHINKLNN